MLKANYGLTPAAYDVMLADQGGQCAVCGATDPRTQAGVFCVDHCHTTGVVRGLLCSACNSGLGHFSDDPDVLRAAASYIEAARSR